MKTLVVLLVLFTISLFTPIGFAIDSNDVSTMDGMDFSLSDPELSLPPVSAPPSPSQMHNPMAVLEAVLSNLGFQELTTAVPSLSDSAYYSWNGPSTVFAPSDDSIRSCRGSCSVPELLREHIVPGLFSFEYLKNLAFGTKLETMRTGRCVTVTSANSNSREVNKTIVYIGGVEITHPDMFNNGMLVVHRLEGFISLLSPFSCNVERMSSVSFPSQQSDVEENRTITSSRQPSPAAVMRLMLKDAMLRLHNNGFSIVSLALKVKYPEIMNLQNMTVFALDDASIFSGAHGYLNNFKFHIVPNRLLMSADLLKLPAGTTLSTLDRDQTLTITSSGSGGGQMRINYVRIKSSDVVYNIKVAVHSIFLAFPHLHPAATTPGTVTTAFDASAVVDSSIFKTIEDRSKSVPSPKSNHFVGGQTFDATMGNPPAMLKSKDAASCSAADKDCVTASGTLKPKESL